MVLAFASSVNLIDLIRINYLWIGGKLCKSSIYHEFSDATRCTNCQLYGHPPALCREKSPICAVCAQDHTTCLHPCKIPSCKCGPAYTHPPIMCRACQEPHKASDSGCPSQAKAEISTTSRWASGARIEENHLSTSPHLIPPIENESIHARSG
jgi:hypothetical protein